jgi:hypothetical protein
MVLQVAILRTETNGEKGKEAEKGPWSSQVEIKRAGWGIDFFHAAERYRQGRNSLFHIPS